MNVVSMSNVNLIRNGHKILSDLDLQIYEGENWVILGPNGVGKTSLVQIIAGRLFATNGEVKILGKKLGTFPTQMLHQMVGFASISLTDNFDPNAIVFEIILTATYGQTAHWKEEYEPQDFERAQALLNIFNIGGLGNRLMRTLSQGEVQKVLLCRALMSDPEILVLDEPTSGLDIATREDLLAGLQEIAQDNTGPTIIMVTHHVEQIPKGFDKIALMKDGKIAVSGDIEQVLTDENISAISDRPINVIKVKDRYFAVGN